MKWLKILIKIHSSFKSEFLCLSFFVRYVLLYYSSNCDGTLVNIVVSPPGKLSEWWGVWELLGGGFQGWVEGNDYLARS